jgi:hypothetical protein
MHTKRTLETVKGRLDPKQQKTFSQHVFLLLKMNIFQSLQRNISTHRIFFRFHKDKQHFRHIFNYLKPQIALKASTEFVVFLVTLDGRKC